MTTRITLTALNGEKQTLDHTSITHIETQKYSKLTLINGSTLIVREAKSRILHYINKTKGS